MMEKQIDQELKAIDAILSSEPPVQPSPRFTASVMEAVRQESSARALSFPWSRFALGCAVSALLGTLTSLMVGGALPGLSHLRAASAGESSWAVPALALWLALVVSFVSVRLSRAMTNPGGLD